MALLRKTRLAAEAAFGLVRRGLAMMWTCSFWAPVVVAPRGACRGRSKLFLARLFDYFDLLIAAVFVDERCRPVRVEFDTIRVATWLGVRARMVRAAGEPRLLFEMSPLILLLFVMARGWLLGAGVGRDEEKRLGGS